MAAIDRGFTKKDNPHKQFIGENYPARQARYVWVAGSTPDIAEINRVGGGG